MYVSLFFMNQTKKNQQEDQSPPSPEEPYYVARVPAEPESIHPGRAEGIISLVCAGVSLLFAPLLFGITGIILGEKSRKKGSRLIGLTGVILSSIFMVIGIVLGIIAVSYEDEIMTDLGGFIGVIFKL